MMEVPASKCWYAHKDWFELVLPADKEVIETCALSSVFLRKLICSL